jgi:glycosyltransferase involved in cell wall biosynthesis
MVHVQKILDPAKNMKTCVIIPTYNESNTIAGLISQVRKLNLGLVVVDDGSNDNTAAIAEKSGATVIRNGINQGKGSALVNGFKYCLKKDFDAAITMDGDGQHLPEDIPEFINLASKKEDLGLIIGNRMADRRNMPLIRVLTNKFMSWLLSRIIKQKIYDSQCGFRLIKRKVLEKLSLKTHKFEIESEMIIEAARAGVKIGSIPIQTVYRKEHSHINPFVDTIRFFSFILKKCYARNEF